MIDLFDDKVLTKCISQKVHNLSDNYQHTQLLIYKIFTIFNKIMEDYEDSCNFCYEQDTEYKKILNLIILIFLPYEIVVDAYLLVDYYKLSELVFLDEIQIFVKKFNYINKKVTNFYMNDGGSAEQDGNYSTLYICKCGDSKVKLKEIQMRRADEGTTVIAHCRNCDRIWYPGH
jgi:hypothetical protein